ncbi:MAG: undecaprenyl-diphosphate phosphatase [Acidimicrobiia bacterium]|nr:undecaprenyl-diphosphate phosphatase [Acidimicrobiia bacterium]MYC57117.1 undecaprenyl-diphosphate phosphatase [Acidimicrobiia bacterium]MYG94781.1 undecaprenyl-diphosphate phosphatase [Acidimicrobiia bacterium]MYI30194.1 undecaprenyl-diphosphate phosphatase [Acidimicrobiia bacterium]
MSVLHAILLGIAQGLTEFLPVSSSGHLQIIPWLADWNDFEGNDDLKKAFDVALHLGTLVGLVTCLRREVWMLIKNGIAAVVDRRTPITDEGRLGWLLILATVPAAVVGVGLRPLIDEIDDEIWLTAVMLGVFGILLWWADRHQGQRSVEAVGIRDVVLLGLAQACSLQPGVSRSGAIITAGRLLYLNREAAARLAMLMSVPVIAGAGLYTFVDIGGWKGIPTDARTAFAWGIAASAVTGFIAVKGLLAVVRTYSLRPFAVYRMLMALLILSLISTNTLS